MARIGFITTAELLEMPESDLVTKVELEKLGHKVVSIGWDTADSTDETDVLVLRSCWNYHLRPQEFLDWLKSQSKPLQNSAATLLWNFDKRYLLEIKSSVPIVPTELVLDPTAAGIKAVCVSRGWAEAIVKPSVGSTAYMSRRLLTDPDFESLGEQQLPPVALVQPYLRQIQTAGEFSVIFFEGKYSHAVVKVPVAGDYRVQEEFGGSTRRIEPPPTVGRIAQAAVDFIPDRPLYAR